MLGVSQNVRGLISKSMKNRNTELTAGEGGGGESFGKVKIRQGIF